MDDPLFHNLETGEIDIEKIPFKDRIAVEAMQNYQENGGDLCQQTPHSGEFLVCPAAKGCAGSNVAGPGGALPSGWFSGVSGKSWDFCAPAARPAESEEPGEGEPGFDQTGNAQYGYDQQYGAYGQQAMHYQCVPGAVTFLVVALHQLQRSSKSAKKGSFL
ncbi:rpl22 [Symbiodinium microadriaticum]|nr:rpl22 [Symbiodinium microadriaticum]